MSLTKMKAIACGGGNPLEGAQDIMRAVFELTEKAKPDILHIGLGLPSRHAFAKSLAQILDFGNRHGASVRPFTDSEGRLAGQEEHGSFDPKEAGEEVDRQEVTRNWVEDILQDVDTVYFAGGDDKKLMARLEEMGILTVLSDAITSGKVVAMGFAAGMTPLFTRAFSDYPNYHVPRGTRWGYAPVGGLDILRAVCCPRTDIPHRQTGTNRGVAFARWLGTQPHGTVGWGLPKYGAVQIMGETATILGKGLDRFVVQPDGVVARDHFPASSSGIPLHALVG